jgi:Sec-independent protein translocase protein TatA
MFGLSFAEIIIIILVVIVFLRPKDFPRLFTKLGRLYGHITRQVGAAKDYLAELENEVKQNEDAELSRDNDSEEK